MKTKSEIYRFQSKIERTIPCYFGASVLPRTINLTWKYKMHTMASLTKETRFLSHACKTIKQPHSLHNVGYLYVNGAKGHFQP